MLDKLIEDMGRAIYHLRQWPVKNIQIFHHNDSDGLSSGAILSLAFEREGFKVRRFCLEKPYPEVLKKIFDQENQLIVFADFAGRIAPMLSELNRGRNLTIILDHHTAKRPTDPKVYNLDPELYGLKGDRDITASTTCYLFARALNAANQDMAHIAAIGAVGDKFFVDGKLVSINRDILMEAVNQGLAEIRKHKAGEQYILKSSRGDIRLDELGDYLDVLGAVGYYQKGPDMGVGVCLRGTSPESDQMVESLREIKQRAFSKEIERLRREGLTMSPHIQWFNLKNRFSNMGVKMVGLLCEEMSNTDLIDQKKYIAGFQIIPNKIPGMGDIDLNQTKISMRVSDYMEKEIRAGRATGLDNFLPEATSRLGGFSDACHSLTAATTVSIGQEGNLIREMEQVLSSHKKGT
jgi:single-stranded-DNA-specific exonuclease